jgi:hypothetical protein
MADKEINKINANNNLDDLNQKTLVTFLTHYVKPILEENNKLKTENEKLKNMGCHYKCYICNKYDYDDIHDITYQKCSYCPIKICLACLKINDYFKKYNYYYNNNKNFTTFYYCPTCEDKHIERLKLNY